MIDCGVTHDTQASRSHSRNRARTAQTNRRDGEGRHESRRDPKYIRLISALLFGIDICITAQYEATLVKLANAEVQIEDLKAQLDDALGAEDLLVQLTERNLMLGEVRDFP